LEAGQVQFNLSTVPVAKVLGAVEALVAPQIMEKGLAYSWDHCGADASDGSPASVRADEEKLRQVILNLVSNAIKFTDAGGRIEVGCGHERDMVTIRVR